MKTFTHKHQALLNYVALDDTRPVLAGIFVDPENNVAVAANGTDLLVMPLIELNDENYPGTPGAGDTNIESVILPASPIKEAIKSIPTKAAKYLSALNHVKVSRANGKVILTTTDAEVARDVAVTPITGTYPKYKELSPQYQPVGNEVSVTTMAVTSLEAILKTAKLVGAQCIRLQFKDSDSVIRIDFSRGGETNKGTIALAMPMSKEIHAQFDYDNIPKQTTTNDGE